MQQDASFYKLCKWVICMKGNPVIGWEIGKLEKLDLLESKELKNEKMEWNGMERDLWSENFIFFILKHKVVKEKELLTHQDLIYVLEKLSLPKR